MRRDICIYNCCPDPFPTLIATVEFGRANYFYQMKLFIPSIAITLVSFATFWLDPDCGERLGFGIAVILAVTMNDVTATSMMPICDSVVLMDYISMICLIFAIFSLWETVVVSNLYFRNDKNWFMAFCPVGGYRIYREIGRKWRHCWRPKNPEGFEVQPQEIPETDRKGLLRLQLYKEIFFSLDRNHSGELEVFEVESFALAVVGSGSDVVTSLDKFDASQNGRLSFDEFTTFCEMNIKEKDNIALLTKLLRGFVRGIDRERASLKIMWKTRAIMVDTFSRLGIPIGYIMSISMVFSMDQADLKEMMGNESRDKQWMMKTFGFYPLIGVTVCYCLFTAWQQFWKDRGQDESLANSQSMMKKARSDHSERVRKSGSEGMEQAAAAMLAAAGGGGEDEDATGSLFAPAPVPSENDRKIDAIVQDFEAEAGVTKEQTDPTSVVVDSPSNTPGVASTDDPNAGAATPEAMRVQPSTLETPVNPDLPWSEEMKRDSSGRRRALI